MTAHAGDRWRDHGEAPALHLDPGVGDGHVLSYRALHQALEERIAGLGRWVADLPRERGRRPLVAVEGARPLHVVVDALACLEVGVDALLVNAAWWPRERDALFERLRPQWIIARRATPGSAPQPSGLAPHDHTAQSDTAQSDTVQSDTVQSDTDRHDDDDPPTVVDGDEPVLWAASAGSDGDPTAYAFRRSQVHDWATPTGERPPGAVVVTGEIAHLATWRAVVGALGAGAEVLLSDRTHLAAVLSHRRLGELYSTPMLVRRALRQLQRRERDVLGIERAVLHQGQIRPHEQQRWPQRFGGSVHGWVSATEAGGWLLHDDRPAPGIEARVEGPDDALLYRGTASAARSARRLRPPAGWDSGDRAERLDDGRLRWAGRRRDVFLADGVPVDPLVVEAALAAHPLVAEVAVAPRPHPERTNLVVAVLVPADPEWPPFLEDLAEVTASLPPQARPQALAIVEDLPTNAAGAVHRRLVNYEEASR